MTQHITDTTDFCRRCDGNGWLTEKTERDTTLSEPCDLCDGTGYRTMKLTERAQSGAHTAGDLSAPHDTEVARHMSRVEAQWISDVLLPNYYDTDWDRMRWIERMQENNVHSHDLRELRAQDYLTAKYDQRDERRGASFINAVLLSCLILIAAFATP